MTYHLDYDLLEQEKEEKLRHVKHGSRVGNAHSQIKQDAHLDNNINISAPTQVLTQRLQSTIKNRPSQMRKSDVKSLQRLAGNKATRSMVIQRDPFAELKGHQDKADKADTATNTVNNVTAVLTPGVNIAGIKTAISNPTTQSGQLSQGGGQTATSAFGTLVSGAALVTDSVGLHHKLQKWRKAKKAGHKDIEHISKRQAKIAGGNVATDAGGVGTGAVNIAAGGLAIAAVSNTALTATAGVTGVVGAVITLPLQLAMMIRGIIRSEKQRKRMMRIHGVKNLKSQNPQDALKSKQESYDNAEKSLTDLKKNLDEANDKHIKSGPALENLRKDVQGAANKTMTPEEKKLAESQKEELKKQEEAFQSNAKDLAELQKKVTEEENKVKIAKTELDGQKEITKALEETALDSGYLDEHGQKVTTLPSIQEIRDYALKKNARGWGRRAIGTTAAGVGVVAGGIGLAAAIESFKGNSDIATDLGIGAAAVGGLAAAIGIGVGIWKLVSWAKKRRDQSKKMKAGATTANKTGPSTVSTYNPLSGSVDQSAKRKYMASALYGYLLHGDSVQKFEAEQLIKALDPKLHDLIKGHNSQTDPFAKDQIIQHLMDKMASGG
ncbi:MAG: hypothetical protein M1374_06400 [Firmicutes bacterium]|nr:hypothetical protein [Bacillota bacterium]